MGKLQKTSRDWILLIHLLPPKPTNLRVRIWRKLQKLGAVAIKNSVYVLPATEQAHEDFQWLKQEIESAGGAAAGGAVGGAAAATGAEAVGGAVPTGGGAATGGPLAPAGAPAFRPPPPPRGGAVSAAAVVAASSTFAMNTPALFCSMPAP